MLFIAFTSVRALQLTELDFSHQGKGPFAENSVKQSLLPAPLPMVDNHWEAAGNFLCLDPSSPDSTKDLRLAVQAAQALKTEHSPPEFLRVPGVLSVAVCSPKLRATVGIQSTINTRGCYDGWSSISHDVTAKPTQGLALILLQDWHFTAVERTILNKGGKKKKKENRYRLH